MSKIKNPQDKKRLDYSRDKNIFGENDGSREGMRKIRRVSAQTERSQNVKLKSLLSGNYDSDYATEVETQYRAANKHNQARADKDNPDLPFEE